MVEISAKDVMKLRNSTGLPMMDCKKALEEAGGNPEKAEELLRIKLKGKMEKRAERAAGEGCIAVAVDEASGKAAIVELRAETDFTAKNEKFVGVARAIAQSALTGSDAAASQVEDLRISTGENISVGRSKVFAGAAGQTRFGTYVHHDRKTGVLLHTTGPSDQQVLNQICMHITANPVRPLGVTPSDIPPAVVDKERQFRINQAMDSGKPKEIAEKMVEGGMRKFYEEVALLEQPFVIDPTKKVKDLLGSGVKVIAFERWEVGGS